MPPKNALQDPNLALSVLKSFAAFFLVYLEKVRMH